MRADEETEPGLPIFGEIAYLRGTERTASVRAKGPIEVLDLTFEDVPRTILDSLMKLAYERTLETRNVFDGGSTGFSSLFDVQTPSNGVARLKALFEKIEPDQKNRNEILANNYQRRMRLRQTLFSTLTEKQMLTASWGQVKPTLKDRKSTRLNSSHG